MASRAVHCHGLSQGQRAGLCFGAPNPHTSPGVQPQLCHCRGAGWPREASAWPHLVLGGAHAPGPRCSDVWEPPGALLPHTMGGHLVLIILLCFPMVGGVEEEERHTGVQLYSCPKYDLVNSAQCSLPEVGKTCFLPCNVSLRDAKCKDFLCSHKKGKETAGKCFTDGKALGISLKRGPPMQMAHYFNIWIFILLKHLFFFPWFYLAS